MLLRIIFVCLVLALPSIGAQAQILQPGEIGIFGDAEGTSDDLLYVPFQPFEVYILAFDLPGGIIAWECSVDLPDEVSVVAVEFDDPNSVNVAQPIPGSNNLNLIVGMGSGCNAYGGLVQLAKITLITYQLLEDIELACLGPAQPSSLVSPGPAYATCTNDVLPLQLAAGYLGHEGCFRIGQGLCGGLLPSRVYFQVLDTFGPPSTSVTMPFEIGRAGYPDCASEDLEVYSLSVRFEWDEAVATLADVVPVGPIAGWTKTITPIPGGVDVHVQGPLTEVTFGSPQTYLDLEFDIGPSDGQTEVSISVGLGSSSFYYTILWERAGTLGTMPVATETTSMGKLKASYR